MVPDENNKKTAEQTVEILLWGVPKAMKPAGRNVVSAIMDDRLRAAMMFVPSDEFFSNESGNTDPLLFRYEKPSKVYFTFISVVFTIRKFVLRYLFFPRPWLMRVHNLGDKPSKEGRYFMYTWETVPWYVQPSLWNRYSFQSWKSWIMGQPAPGDEGEKYWPKGYKILEIGPDSMRGKGEGYVRESREKLVAERMKGCPFAGAKT